MSTHVTVLGPQRRTTATRTAVAELVPTGSVAAINAGWRERESADAELGEVLGGRMVNLGLYRTFLQPWVRAMTTAQTAGLTLDALRSMKPKDQQ